MTLSYKKGYKYKPGDLVKFPDKDWHLCHSIGVIIGPKKLTIDEYESILSLNKAYSIFWTKRGLTKTWNRCFF